MSITVWWNRLPACINDCVVEQASSLCQALCGGTGFQPVSMTVWWNRLPACVKHCVVEQASSLCE
ncbi:hypothetical protein [Moorena producens]|uniref:hypothetical protein n=1 Tax=Moorena producens TaxID=1155739 RepID=UPI003C74384C